jgi:hypothetical protein
MLYVSTAEQAESKLGKFKIGRSKTPRGGYP